MKKLKFKVQISENLKKSSDLFPKSLKDKLRSLKQRLSEDPRAHSLHARRLYLCHKEFWQVGIEKNCQVFYRILENHVVRLEMILVKRAAL